jgi:endonuclease-8
VSRRRVLASRDGRANAYNASPALDGALTGRADTGPVPEGPSIVILKEAAAGFAGRLVSRVHGNSREPIQRMAGQRLLALRSWGKHFLVEFDGFSLRVHFLLFGSYRIDERKEVPPRVGLEFEDGSELNFYACSVKFIEGPLDAAYDWSADVMNDAWDPAQARRKLRTQPMALAADALLDQQLFAGVGNIIKNEVLHRIRLHPESRVGALPARKLGELVTQAREYSFDFLRWKKAYVLRQHYQVHTRTHCPRDGHRLSYRKHLGLARRRAFFCEQCQRLYE